MRPGQPSATRLHALSALTSAVAQNAAGQDAARAAGALGVVAAMLSAGDDAAALHGATAVYYLVQDNPKSQDMARRSGLVDALRSGRHPAAAEPALRLLGVAGATVTANASASAGSVPSLGRPLATSASISARRPTAGTVAPAPLPVGYVS